MGKISFKPYLILIIMGGLLIVSACHTLPQRTLPYGVAHEIPQGANRIMLKQEAVPPADVYADALYYLKRHDFKITASQELLDTDSLEDLLESAPLTFAAKKQIKDNLAIRILGNVNAYAGGGILIVSVEYASSVDQSIAQWKKAKWTSGKSQEAFFKGLEIIRGTRYDAMDFEVGVAITSD